MRQGYPGKPLCLTAMSSKTGHDMMQRAFQNMKAPTTAVAGVTCLLTASAGQDAFAYLVNLSTKWGRMYATSQCSQPLANLIEETQQHANCEHSHLVLRSGHNPG